jgi:ABC-type nitrate/sulfonate/bicarbonate transport system ATPase subunit
VSEQGSRLVSTDAVRNVDLSIPLLQFVSVVGSSGCGKTTLLRLVAGLLAPTRGRIVVDGRPVTGPGPDRVVVFQEDALYPWRTVRANVALGLELGRMETGDDARNLVERYLALVGLSDFGDHYPNQLSGGMRQRVGLARALAVRPSTLLMDEPFGSLDAITRTRLGAELLTIWERDQRTVLFVTHSLDEALVLSDRVIVMREGALVSDIAVDFPRPRDPEAISEETAFLELRRSLSHLL